ncbi:hypothetical protein D3C78_1907150 [compost metagenome]
MVIEKDSKARAASLQIAVEDHTEVLLDAVRYIEEVFGGTAFRDHSVQKLPKY